MAKHDPLDNLRAAVLASSTPANLLHLPGDIFGVYVEEAIADHAVVYDAAGKLAIGLPEVTVDYSCPAHVQDDWSLPIKGSAFLEKDGETIDVRFRRIADDAERCVAVYRVGVW